MGGLCICEWWRRYRVRSSTMSSRVLSLALSLALTRGLMDDDAIGRRVAALRTSQLPSRRRPDECSAEWCSGVLNAITTCFWCKSRLLIARWPPKCLTVTSGRSAETPLGGTLRAGWCTSESVLPTAKQHTRMCARPHLICRTSSASSRGGRRGLGTREGSHSLSLHRVDRVCVNACRKFDESTSIQ